MLGERADNKKKRARLDREEAEHDGDEAVNFEDIENNKAQDWMRMIVLTILMTRTMWPLSRPIVHWSAVSEV